MILDPSWLQDASPLAFLLVFLGGVVTSIGPCNLAAIPLVVGYVGGSRELARRRAFVLSLTFAIGMALTFMLLGVAAAVVGGLMGAWRGWYYALAAVCLAIGLNMLGVFNWQIPMGFGGWRERVGMRGLAGALALGLVSGLVASQCATPVLAAILTYVMAKGALVLGAGLLFVYALGRGVPVVLAGTFTGVLKQAASLGRWTAVIEKASGLIVIAVGLYFLWLA